MLNCCNQQSQHLEKSTSKRAFLKHISLSALTLGVAGMATQTAFAADNPPKEKTPPKAQNILSPDAALERLLKGNQRYMSGKSQPFEFSKDRAALVGGQNPYASILSCADARVVPEQCFDEQRGDLFVTRVAGNYVTSDVLASLEYGAAVLKVPLIMVLGHQHCGAVGATIAAVEKHQQFPGHIQTLTTAIAPAVRAVAHMKGNQSDNAIKQNVMLNVEKLKVAAPILSKLVAEKKVRIVGGVYNLATGKVEIVG
ncbi:carbonic anhydrase [Glaciimonas sp. GG7]